MTTYNELVEQTLSEVSSYSKNQESITVLLEDVSSSDLDLSVDSVSALSKGLIEVNDELMYLKETDATESVAKILTSTRGFKGTSATSHAAGSIVRNNPIFTRSQVKRAINDTIKGMAFPVIKTYDFLFDGTVFAYPLPTDCTDVTGIGWDAPDTTGIWQPLTDWYLDKNYIVEGELRPRRALILREAPMPGRTVRVQYSGDATPLENGDEFEDSGLPFSCEDVVRYGAMWRLITTVDPGKVIARSPSADLVDQPVQAGTAVNVSRYLYQLYTVRLEEERVRVLHDYQQTINYRR
jgi:hypothetical protein